MPVTAPADRRFLRAQVKPGKRQTPWRTWIRLARTVLLAALLLWAGWWCATAVAAAPGLRVERITVSGTQHLSPGEVLALLDGLRGRNILFVRLHEWRARVLACPWVGEAAFRRSLPGTIEVRIVERRPIAIGRIGQELFLVDDRGGVIDEYGPRYADFDLPVLDGLAPGGAKEAAANERRADLATRLLRDVRKRPDLARRISRLDVSDPRDAVVTVDQDTAHLRLGDDRFAERLQSYLDMASVLRERVPAIDYVDLRFGERIFVGSQAAAVPVQPPSPRRPGATSQ